MLLKNISLLSTTSSLYGIERNLAISLLNQNNQDKSYNTDDPSEYKKSTMTVEDYISSKKVLSKYKELIPSEYLRRKSSLDSMYLVDPDVARKIYKSISPYLSKNSNKVIAECNPGLGLLTKYLLRNENGLIKLFEPTKSFRTYLKELATTNHGKFQLYSKNLFKLPSYNYIDRIDNGERVEKLLEGIPKKAWNDDPSISIIGPMLNNMFFHYLISALPKQTSLISYGRVEIFAVMKPSHYWALSVQKDFYKVRYNYTVVLFNVYFDYKVLCKIPRREFLPWERNKKKRKTKLDDIDKDMLYLVHIVTKKDLLLPMEQIIPFNFFIRRFYNKKARVVPTFEFCVPDSGVHVIFPKLQHENYFENINIFTEFRELTPEQILSVFREMYNHPNYPGSPFSEMIDADIVKSASLEENHISVSDSSFLDEMEELELQENLTEDSTNY